MFLSAYFQRNMFIAYTCADCGESLKLEITGESSQLPCDVLVSMHVRKLRLTSYETWVTRRRAKYLQRLMTSLKQVMIIANFRDFDPLEASPPRPFVISASSLTTSPWHIRRFDLCSIATFAIRPSTRLRRPRLLRKARR
jgi:hypothetical protein